MYTSYHTGSWYIQCGAPPSATRGYAAAVTQDRQLSAPRRRASCPNRAQFSAVRVRARSIRYVNKMCRDPIRTRINPASLIKSRSNQNPSTHHSQKILSPVSSSLCSSLFSFEVCRFFVGLSVLTISIINIVE